MRQGVLDVVVLFIINIHVISIYSLLEKSDMRFIL